MFVDFLALLCWIGTVYAFTVPVWHLIFDEEADDKKLALKVLGLLVVVWFTIRFLEKGVLDRIMQYNTVPAVGRWSNINSTDVLTNIEFHDPYPSFPSGHMLLGVGTGLFLLKYYNSLNTKILMIVCICTSAFIKMYMGMHSIWDIGFTILLVVSVYYLIMKVHCHFFGSEWFHEKKKTMLMCKPSSLCVIEQIIKLIMFAWIMFMFLVLFFELCNIILPLI